MKAKSHRINKKIQQFFLGLLSFIVIIILIFIAFANRYTYLNFKQKTNLYNKVSYKNIVGWKKDLGINNFITPFSDSCKKISHYKNNKVITKYPKETKVNTWVNVCNKFKKLQISLSKKNHKAEINDQIYKFIEINFTPYLVKGVNKSHITGYYRLKIKGSSVQTKQYKYPLYKKPKDLIIVNLRKFLPKEYDNKYIYGRVSHQSLVKYYTRKEIENGKLKNRGLELLWLENPVDIFLLQTQGSGLIEMENNQKVYVSYAGKNGFKYRGIYNYLTLHSKSLNLKESGIKRIYEYYDKYPNRIQSILNHNKSFIFFKTVKKDSWVGKFGTFLYSERTIAVDPKYEVLGLPLWLSMSNPKTNEDMYRMVVSNDVGSAIKGPARVDFYWGLGAKAGSSAAHTNQKGSMYLFLPKKVNNIQN